MAGFEPVSTAARSSSLLGSMASFVGLVALYMGEGPKGRRQGELGASHVAEEGGRLQYGRRPHLGLSAGASGSSSVATALLLAMRSCILS